LALAGTFFGLRWINNRKSENTNFSDKLIATLRKTQRYTIGTLTLVTCPGVILRLMGTRIAEKIYIPLVENRWLTVMLLGASTVLGVVTFVYPRERLLQKRLLWISSSLVIGAWLGPLFLLPQNFISVAAGYTLSLAIPMTLVSVVANNWLFLNVGSLVTCCWSVWLTHEFFLEKKYGSGVNLLLGVVASQGILLLLNMNRIVRLIEEDEEDSVDEIQLALQLSTVTITTYLVITWKMLKAIKRFTLSGRKEQKKKPRRFWWQLM